MAVAVNDTTFNEAIVGISDIISRKDLLLTCPIIITLSAVSIVCFILGLCGADKWLQKENNGLSDQIKSTILSLTLISVGRLISFICFDSVAVHTKLQTNSQTIDVKYLNDSVVGFIQAMQNVPVILLAFDILALTASLVLIIGAAIATCKYRRLCCKDAQYYILALTQVFLFSSCVIHAPYIIMAYVSDASYASSIFVYYMVEIFVEFGLNQYVFSIYFKFMKKRYNFRSKEEDNYYKVQKYTFIPCPLAVFLAVVINALMITIFLYFYYLPIKYILNNGPSQFVLIYQSGVLFVGAFVTYKAVFKRDTDKLQKTLDDLHEWLTGGQQQVVDSCATPSKPKPKPKPFQSRGLACKTKQEDDIELQHLDPGKQQLEEDT